MPHRRLHHSSRPTNAAIRRCQAAIADAILDRQFGDMSPPEPDQHWQDWLGGLAQRLRRALIAHPDGARIRVLAWRFVIVDLPARRRPAWPGSRRGCIHAPVGRLRAMTVGDRAGLRYPIEPMIASTASALPVGPWCYQPKWDGWRAIGWTRENRVQIQTRSGRAVTTAFPEISRALRTLPPGTVVDGELVVWDPDRERTSFALLQRRAAAGRHVLRAARRYPAHFVIFDVLGTARESLLPVPLERRREVLENLLADVPPQLVLCPQSTDVADAADWIESWTATGIEGVVAKRLDQGYRAGRAGWKKLRVRSTTEMIIGGVTGWVNAPQALLVGRLDRRGTLRYEGRSVPLSDIERAELAPLLSAPVAQRRGAESGHPWPQPLPASWTGHWDRRGPVRYHQVQPSVVAEVQADTAFEHGRYRHPVVYLRPRRDMSIYDVPLHGID